MKTPNFTDRLSAASAAKRAQLERARAIAEDPERLQQLKARTEIVAARKAEQLEDNIAAADLQLSDEDVQLLDAASDPGVPYPKWMVLQLDTAEDPRSKALYPERYAGGGPWKDLRGSRWSS